MPLYFHNSLQSNANQRKQQVEIASRNITIPSEANRGYTIYLLVPDGELSLSNLTFEKKSAFVFGHEEFAPSFSANDFPEIKTVSIPQFGVTESLNVSNATAIVMFEYTRQYAGDGEATAAF